MSKKTKTKMKAAAKVPRSNSDKPKRKIALENSPDSAKDEGVDTRFQSIKKNPKFIKTDKPFVLIMAGGSGTRLWPLSRNYRPKQLVPLLGKQSMIEDTLERAKRVTSVDRIFIGTNKDLAQKMQKVLNLKSEQYLIEPVGRNTAPIIAYFSAFLKANGADDSATIVVLSADHFVHPKEAWSESIMKTFSRNNERIWCVGIKPTRADTGYGYIESGVEVAPGLLMISSFREKPDYATAAHYTTSGNYYWNSGMFIFSVGRIREEFRQLQPAMLKLADECAQGSKQLKTAFPKMANISIDYAIMEKTKRIGMVRADFQWDDVGSYEALTRIFAADANHNFPIGSQSQIFSHRAKGNIVKSNLKVALLGLDNCVIIEQDGILLVAKRDALEDIKVIREIAGEANQ